MTRASMDEEELRARVQEDIEVDAIEVDLEDEETEIRLFFHEPETQTKPVRTPFGYFIAVNRPDSEKLLQRLMDEIHSHTSPDGVNIVDMNGYFQVTLTYEGDRHW